ncbi:hypothetical protein MRX96_013973 [Rhipicephalus microplus]
MDFVTLTRSSIRAEDDAARTMACDARTAALTAPNDEVPTTKYQNVRPTTRALREPPRHRTNPSGLEKQVSVSPSLRLPERPAAQRPAPEHRQKRKQLSGS